MLSGEEKNEMQTGNPQVSLHRLLLQGLKVQTARVETYAAELEAVLGFHQACQREHQNTAGDQIAKHASEVLGLVKQHWNAQPPSDVERLFVKTLKQQKRDLLEDCPASPAGKSSHGHALKDEDEFMNRDSALHLKGLSRYLDEIYSSRFDPQFTAGNETVNLKEKLGFRTIEAELAKRLHAYTAIQNRSLRLVVTYDIYADSPPIVSALDCSSSNTLVAMGGVTNLIKVYRYQELNALLSAPLSEQPSIHTFDGIDSQSVSGNSNGNENDDDDDEEEDGEFAPSIVREISTHLPTGAGLSGLYTAINPVYELTTKYKVSNLKFHPYVEEEIAYSDYEGLVNLWNLELGASTGSLVEHTKRVWSIDFHKKNACLLASGSDDKHACGWDTRTREKTFDLTQTSNVCSVEFSAESPQLLAVGCAGHDILLYDIRNTSKEIKCLQGHTRAVSYVHFIPGSRLASSSTDGSLRVWDVSDRHGPAKMIRKYWGHKNEKNFTGLSHCMDYLVSGSEDNSVYFYHTDLERPVHRISCSRRKRQTEEPGFVSCVLWNEQQDHLFVGNSFGDVRVFA